MFVFPLLLTISCLVQATEFQVKKPNFQTTNNVGNVKLFHNKNGFYVVEGLRKQRIKNFDVERELRNINNDQLSSYLKYGYLNLNKFDNGDYALRAKTRGNGGGPATAVTANVAVQAVGFGVPIATAGVVAAVVPGGTAVVAATINFCNISGVTAGYILGVRAAAKTAALIGLFLPLP